VRRIIERHVPRKVILFSRKGWPLWPEFDGRYREPARKLAEAPLAEWGSYKTDADWETLAYNLPHPQFQRVQELTAAVKAIVAHMP
jgi:hypothetical protein